MKKNKNNKGITMISLVITIIVLIILATMITQTGMASIKNSKFEKLKNELEIVQSNINVWHEKYRDTPYNEITSIGIVVPDKKLESLKQQLQEIKYNGININTDISVYRYLGKNEFEDLQISGIENDYIIDVKNQVAIIVDGYEFDGNMYYMLDQIRNVTRSEKINMNYTQK